MDPNKKKCEIQKLQTDLKLGTYGGLFFHTLNGVLGCPCGLRWTLARTVITGALSVLRKVSPIWPVTFICSCTRVLRTHTLTHIHTHYIKFFVWLVLFDSMYVNHLSAWWMRGERRVLNPAVIQGSCELPCKCLKLNLLPLDVALIITELSLQPVVYLFSPHLSLF